MDPEELEIVNKLYASGIRPMEDSEIDNADFIHNLLPDTQYPYLSVGQEEKIEPVIYVAGNTFSIYKDKILEKRMEKMALKAEYVSAFKHPLQFGCRVADNTRSLVLDIFKVPYVFDRESPIFLGHEYHHALKDTNKEEYNLMMRYADVIPIFYELVTADSKPKDIKANLLRARINMLNLDKRKYRLYRELPRGYIVVDFKTSKSGQYLNSYYYALALFRVYKEKPGIVLGLVSKVLKHEITTIEMLMVLDLYEVDLNKEVSEEHNEIIRGL
jgi:hypothetical protein